MLYRTYGGDSLVAVAKSAHDQYSRSVRVPTRESEAHQKKALQAAGVSAGSAAGSGVSLAALGSKAGRPRAILFGTGVSAGAGMSGLAAWKAAREARKSSKAKTKISVLHGKAE